MNLTGTRVNKLTMKVIAALIILLPQENLALKTLYVIPGLHSDIHETVYTAWGQFTMILQGILNPTEISFSTPLETTV